MIDTFLVADTFVEVGIADLRCNVDSGALANIHIFDDSNGTIK